MPPKKTTSDAADGGTGTTSEKAVGGRRRGVARPTSDEEEESSRDHAAVEEGRAPEARARAASADVAERDTTGEELDTESTSVRTSARRGVARPASDEEEEDSRSDVEESSALLSKNGLIKRHNASIQLLRAALQDLKFTGDAAAAPSIVGVLSEFQRVAKDLDIPESLWSVLVRPVLGPGPAQALRTSRAVTWTEIKRVLLNIYRGSRATWTVQIAQLKLSDFGEYVRSATAIVAEEQLRRGLETEFDEDMEDRFLLEAGDTFINDVKIRKCHVGMSAFANVRGRLKFAEATERYLVSADFAAGPDMRGAAAATTPAPQGPERPEEVATTAAAWRRGSGGRGFVRGFGARARGGWRSRGDGGRRRDRHGDGGDDEWGEEDPRCFNCGQPGHLARGCLGKPPKNGRRGPPRT